MSDHLHVWNPSGGCATCSCNYGIDWCPVRRPSPDGSVLQTCWLEDHEDRPGLGHAWNHSAAVAKSDDDTVTEIEFGLSKVSGAPAGYVVTYSKHEGECDHD